MQLWLKKKLGRSLKLAQRDRSETTRMIDSSTNASSTASQSKTRQSELPIRKTKFSPNSMSTGNIKKLSKLKSMKMNFCIKIH